MISIQSLLANQQEYAVTPVTVDELKLYLQLEGTAYDTQLQAYLWAATEQVEQYTNTSLSAKTVFCTFQQRSYPSRLPLSPLDEVLTAKWKKCPLQLVDATYTIDDDGNFIGENNNGSLPYPTYRVEYTTTPSTNRALIEAVKMQAGHMYNTRDDYKGDWQPTAKALCNSNRQGNF